MAQDDTAWLIRQAHRCRNIAASLGDDTARAALCVLADEYEARAKVAPDCEVASAGPDQAPTG